MSKSSLLGPQGDRKKTDLRLPVELVKQVEQLCTRLGIPKNAFFALAAGKLIIELSPLVNDAVKRREMWAEVEKLVQKVLASAKKKG